jgi:hypothetical protein
VFCDKFLDEWTRGGIPAALVMHVSDAVNRTLWCMRMCHPNPAHLILMSKLSKGMPKINHPQDIKQCSECIIAKMRKTARGHSTGYASTAVGQGLTMDVGFMFQQSKSKNRSKQLIGINGENAYYIIYNFFSELLFRVTMRGKNIPIMCLHVLLTCITPKDHPF